MGIGYGSQLFLLFIVPMAHQLPLLRPPDSPCRGSYRLMFRIHWCSVRYTPFLPNAKTKIENLYYLHQGTCDALCLPNCRRREPHASGRFQRYLEIRQFPPVPTSLKFIELSLTSNSGSFSRRAPGKCTIETRS